MKNAHRSIYSNSLTRACVRNYNWKTIKELNFQLSFACWTSSLEQILIYVIMIIVVVLFFFDCFIFFYVCSSLFFCCWIFSLSFSFHHWFVSRNFVYVWILLCTMIRLFNTWNCPCTRITSVTHSHSHSTIVRFARSTDCLGNSENKFLTIANANVWMTWRWCL